MSWIQADENDEAQVILTCPPNATNSIGTYHPSGFLYVSHVSFSAALSEHARFRQLLEDHGCQVHSVLDVLRMNCDEDPEARASLERFAASCLHYQLLDDDEAHLGSPYMEQLSEEYKLKSLQNMSPSQLVDIILTNPTLMLKKAPLNTLFECKSVSMNPLANLASSRDSLIVTARGVVIASMAAFNRKPEVEVTKFCLAKLGIPILGQVDSPGCLEGGDFLPAGRSLCFLGAGIRTNSRGIAQLLANNWLGTDRVAVVKDYFDRKQERMHVDTLFNLVSSSAAFLHEGAAENSPTCRYVDEYRKTEQDQYVLVEHDVPFPVYLKSEGYEIIFFSDRVQANYGPNFIHLSPQKIICVDGEAANLIAPHFPGDIVVHPYRNVADMNGGFHCTTQVLRRLEKPRPLELERAAVAACCLGDAPAVLSCLKEGVKVNDTFCSGHALIHLAVIFDHLSLVKALLNASARIDLCTSSLFSPLDLALLVSSPQQRDSPVVQYLTQRGARVRRLSLSSPPNLSPSNSELIAQLRGNFSHSLLASLLASLPQPALDAPLGWICCKTPLDSPHPASQSSRRLLMVVPAIFSTNLKLTCQSPIPPITDREVICDVQRAYSHVVHTLSNCGVEVYLDTSDEFEQAPYAFLIGSYFSTHLTPHSRRSALLHPLTNSHHATHNPFYKRLVSFLQDKYQHLVSPSDASPTTPIHHAPSTPPVLQYNHFATVFDRANHIAYSSSLDPHLPHALRLLGYAHAHVPPSSSPLSKSADVDSFMLVGTHVLLLCQDWPSAPDSECPSDTLKSLELTQSNKTIIKFSPEQAARGAIRNSMELLGEKNQPILLTSDSCSSLWTKQQLEALAQTGTKHVSVDLGPIEQLVQGSMQTLFAPLF
ncbi:uncharacterized protein LOC126326522 [Schistocerca gregaria]|uniref:uncharacterized protein LOC126326522 n=1 Tax=Schistocerca gregaria TaxID=7010 RepID=UPI00211DC082|nr:uncharacterized protein LOC126326522 [Schistocerca gregaria]